MLSPYVVMLSDQTIQLGQLRLNNQLPINEHEWPAKESGLPDHPLQHLHLGHGRRFQFQLCDTGTADREEIGGGPVPQDASQLIGVQALSEEVTLSEREAFGQERRSRFLARLSVFSPEQGDGHRRHGRST